MPNGELSGRGRLGGIRSASLMTNVYRRQRVPEDRELIEPHDGDKRYVRRDEQGEFTDSQDDVSRSLSQDPRKDAKTEVPKGQGDRGDQRE
jgi:hypothetical protein